MSNKVLVLLSSPLPKDKSISTYLTIKFVHDYLKQHPNDEINYLDLNEIESASTILKALNFSAFFENNFISDKYINLLKNSNKLIIAAPMINFNVPTTLKSFIDYICIANKTFSYKYSAKGESKGLLDNLDVQIIATQGAPKDWYLFSSHKDYLEGLWKFLGSNVKPTIHVTSLKTKEFSQKSREEIYELYKSEIKKRAKEF